VPKPEVLKHPETLAHPLVAGATTYFLEQPHVAAVCTVLANSVELREMVQRIDFGIQVRGEGLGPRLMICACSCATASEAWVRVCALYAAHTFHTWGVWVYRIMNWPNRF
jgi:hypothetical protein